MDKENLAFLSQYTEQPHASRRIEILKKHPEIKKFMLAKGDRSRIAECLALCLIHLLLGLVNTSKSVPMPFKFLWAVVPGSLVSSRLFLNIHEAAHGLLCGPAHPRLNKLMGISLSVAYGIPIFAFFKKHHLDHHKYQGDTEFDIEYPSELEMKLFSGNFATKFIWLQLNPILLQLRGYLCGRHKLDRDDLLNIAVCAVFAIVGVATNYYHLVGYLMLSAFFASGAGLIGIWGLIVHTVYNNDEDTTSYYGWMNKYLLNAGYHMEHHDFPNIPARYLPEVNRIAPEFYCQNHQLGSFIAPVVKFLHDPNIGVHSRLKRIIPSLHADKRE